MKIGTGNIRRILFYALLLVFLIQCKKEDPDSKGNDSVTPHDLLSGEKYDKLIVEIQYINGFQPTQSTLDNLKAFLEQRLNKPGGISFVQNSIASPGKSSYSLTDIEALEKAHRTQNKNGNTLGAYFIFMDADYSGNSGSSKVLGIAYGSTSMVVFEKTIKDFSGGIGKPSATSLETTVINHEFGHTLGLVNNGTQMKTAHQDAVNGKHCSDKNCLMYYTAETSDFIANLIGNNIPVLDSQCISDLQANGGK